MVRSFRDVLGATGAAVLPSARPPVDLVDELATTLTDRSPYKVRFDVRVTTTGDKVLNTLVAVVPRLDNYILQLLTASHDVLKLYPVTLAGLVVGRVLRADDEDELFDALAAAVTSGEFANIYGTLVAQG